MNKRMHFCALFTRPAIISIFLSVVASFTAYGQTTPCVPASTFARWGLDAGLYSGIIEHGSGVEAAAPYSNDWFQGLNGIGVIDESNTGAIRSLLQAPGNPTFQVNMKYNASALIGGQILMDAIFARDHFGGTGALDPTSFVQASKNGDDPALWFPGTSNVLGKNDIVDVGGFMYRDGLTLNSNLWFIGLFNMAEPGGTAYMDFEFYVHSIFLNTGGNKFTSGGQQLGHTAYTFDAGGNITKVGDFIFSVSLLSSGPVVQTRLWVSYSDWLTKTPAKFDWDGTYDGAYTGAPFGYAGIKPKPGAPQEYCGYVNMAGQTPLAPPWGTKNTKNNVWGTTYLEYSLAEVGINLTAYGMDHSSLLGVTDSCYFPLNSFIVKTRTSASFTSQLKDFAGPFVWGRNFLEAIAEATPLSCDYSVASVTAYPIRADVTYIWTTPDGNILNQVPGEPWKILVDKPGRYDVSMILPTGCPTLSASATVIYDPEKPLFTGPPTITYQVPCEPNQASITATASGATKPYTFYLYKDNVLQAQATRSITESSHTFTGLDTGTYRVDVRGAYSCIVTSGPFTISDKTSLAISLASSTNATCFGIRNGSINIDVSGGKPPLAYLWNTGNTTQNLSNIGAGSYTIAITDGDGCTTTATYTITQPPQLTLSLAKTNDTNPDPAIGTGSITATAAGGTPLTASPYYNFSWIGPNGFVNSAKDIANLKYGLYTLTITDANGCVTSASAFIYEPEICNDGIDNDGDGLGDCADSDCIPAQPGLITASDDTPCVDADGVAPYPFTYTYSVPENTSYDSYVWTVPTNAILLLGQGSRTITVAWLSIAGGQICVRGKKYECLSAPRCITVTVDNVPPKPSDIIFDNH